MPCDVKGMLNHYNITWLNKMSDVKSYSNNFWAPLIFLNTLQVNSV